MKCWCHKDGPSTYPRSFCSPKSQPGSGTDSQIMGNATFQQRRLWYAMWTYKNRSKWVLRHTNFPLRKNVCIQISIFVFCMEITSPFCTGTLFASFEGPNYHNMTNGSCIGYTSIAFAIRAHVGNSFYLLVTYRFKRSQCICSIKMNNS